MASAKHAQVTTQTADPAAPANEVEAAAWQTARAASGPVPSFSSRLIVSFALTAVMTATLLVAVLGVVWEGQFQSYTRENMERLAENVAGALARSYFQDNGWTAANLQAATSASAQSSDVGVQVLNESNTIIYDDTWTLTAVDTGEPAVSLAPVTPDSTVSADIRVDGERVGTVRVWAFGNDALLTSNDAAFRTNSYGAVATAGCAAVLLACVMGVFISRSLSRPIKHIASAAKAIRNGDLTARTNLVGDDELGNLGETFDDMAATVERDMQMEHRLTSDVAHELRTPLMAMLVNVEAMQDGVLPADDEHLGLVAGEVRRLSRLVDAMLRLSRIENGTTSVKPEVSDVGAMMSDLVETQEGLFRDQDLELAYVAEAPEEDLVCEVDPDMLMQAVANLMSNALRYTPAGGRVTVICGRGGKDVTVAVADTGIGIAEEDLPRVFSRFWRSDASRERVSGGLGVGLSLVKEIVSRHNGYVEVKSELGQGSVFTIHLPVNQKGKGGQSKA